MPRAWANFPLVAWPVLGHGALEILRVADWAAREFAVAPPLAVGRELARGRHRRRRGRAGPADAYARYFYDRIDPLTNVASYAHRPALAFECGAIDERVPPDGARRQLAPEAGAVFTRSDALKWFNQHYPKVKDGTVNAHLLRFSTNSRSRHHYSARPDESLLYQIDQGRFRRYDPATDPPPLDEQVAGEEGSDDGDDAPNDIREFAYEKDLRNFLARNLELVERGLRLYEEEGITGVEFPVGGRFADLLGVDANGLLVVIELKVSRGYDRVIGQLLRYMAWISKHQAEPGQGVRGMIIARDIRRRSCRSGWATIPRPSHGAPTSTCYPAWERPQLGASRT